MNFPMSTYWHDERAQVIYLAGEIGGAGKITALALDVATLPGQTMNNWTVRMKHTSLTSYPSYVWEGSGWTLVHQDNLTVTASGWVVIPLASPFDYNGTDNLMVDFSFNNSSYTTAGYCRTTLRSGVRTLYYSSDSEDGDPLSWSGSTPFPTTSSYTPNVRLAVTRVSPGLIEPAVACLANGVWVGSVTATAPVAVTSVSADDGSGHVGQPFPDREPRLAAPAGTVHRRVPLLCVPDAGKFSRI